MKKVLISWIARNHDPYKRKYNNIREFVLKDGQREWGPTLRLLFDKKSPYVEKISDAILLYRVPKKDTNTTPDIEKQLARQTINEIKKQASKVGHSINIHSEIWQGDDPTDHLSIFEFLKSKIKELRKKFANQELVIHVSPGTPSMHTIWVLMSETGFIEKPFCVVKSYREGEQEDKSPIMPVEVGIDTFYKAYKDSKSRYSLPEEQSLFWNPDRFRSEKLKSVYREAKRFAQLKIPILILGERGTGKTTLANWIRTHSPYRKKELDQSWASVTCGQFSAEMMRAELCGYKKGAFTGATSSKTGLLKIADKDTLFLDEIGDITKDLQRLLIRAVEEGKFYPLGSDNIEKSDFRLLSATNQPYNKLSEMLDADFYDRISMFKLRLPSLSEIKEDISWLWEEVWLEAMKRSGANSFHLEQKEHNVIVKKLQQHPLPGNLRDLFKIAYRLIAISIDDSNEDPIEYALEALQNMKLSKDTLFDQVIECIYLDKPLQNLISEKGIFPVKEIQKSFKQYLGNSLKRFPPRKGKKARDLYDIDEKTINNWVNRK